MVKLVKMACEEDVNCYCFNPACNKSIFNSREFSGLKISLSTVLTEEICCPACGVELISRPILDIRMLLFNTLKAPLHVIPIQTYLSS